MRELNETGWINNRVRIIVATLLTKDLHINWQWGEEYFMNQLIDGDLAANNGNWQWVASTGAENQPYFRVMNVWLQSERFDGDGAYIRKWVPELKACKARDLHAEGADRSAYGYPKPMVDHQQAKVKAIAMFKHP
jgi:deoxyribodipyrimidine photo-lyase